MKSQNADAKLLARGVYMPMCLDEGGYRYLSVIDSRHRCIHRQRIFDMSEVSEQTRACRALLEQLDPQPER